MTYEQTKELQDHREQRQHEIVLEVMRVLERDPDMKYFIVAMFGSIAAFIGMMLSPTESKQTSTQDTTMEYGFAWLVGGLPAEEGLAALKALGIDPLDPFRGSGNNDMAGVCANVLKLAGAGAAASCWSILFIKALMGEKGAQGLLGGLASAGMGVM